ncbi:MAG: COG4280 domain-containing protein [Solirubrobacteraceae bacterium]
MTGPELGLAVAVFLACAVEAVEALTIVLAVGITRGWRSTLIGVAGAVALLAAVTAALGPALTALPIDVLRLVVGALLLIFGLQWLRKAILRAAGMKAQRDELREFEHEREEARAAGRSDTSFDPYSFTIAFKGVFLEGMEVVFIVLTFGANQHNVGLAAAAAGAAVALVALLGVALHRPLARVPENAMKFSVGVMLTSFGTFWGAEGAGVAWPGGDAALLVIVPATLLVALGMVALLRRQRAVAPPGTPEAVLGG